MNVEHISDAMELLDDDIIDEANALRGGMRWSAGRTRWLAAAACLALAVCAGRGCCTRAGTCPGLLPTICPGCP